jgi:hypothetical protein
MDEGLFGGTSGKLDVARADFISVQALSWEELFSGFKRLYAITYSSGVDFVCGLLKKFEKAEIIFGCEGVLSWTMQEVFAAQAVTVERIKMSASKNKLDLLSRIKDGTLALHVARKQISHEKIYLLENEGGAQRVITGSANMSRNAFGGIQRENIIMFDGEKAFVWYKSVFDALRDEAADEISGKLLAREVNLCEDMALLLDEHPVAETVNIKKTVVIETAPPENVLDEVRFNLDVKNLSGKLKPFMPKADKGGLVRLTPETVRSVARNLQNAEKQESDLRGEYPRLEIDIDNKIVCLGGSVLDLNPPEEEVRCDITLFLDYMRGFERFHGEIEAMQKRYFELANWFFASPFLAAMRQAAALHSHTLLPYPVFALVYGQSKAGKTSFLETLLKMMIGQKPKVAAPDFTRSNIEGLKRRVLGAPIIVDDLTQARFSQHAVETIKNDDFGVVEHLTNYPAVVISANEDVKAVAPEIRRRTVICHVQAGLTNTEIIKNSVVRRIQRGIGTAFYREYLRLLLERVPVLLDTLHSENESGEEEQPPDILGESSRIICGLVEKYAPPLPSFVRPLTLDNYFNERVTGEQVIKMIQEAWKINRKAFAVDKKRNQLRYNAAQVWEADRIIKELPEDLRPAKSREWVVMDLAAARGFFGVDFRRRRRLFG